MTDENQVLNEKAVPPPEEFRKRARVKSMLEYERLYRWALDDPEGYWSEQAKLLDWFEAPKKVFEWELPHVKWFVGGKLNVSYNCLDRHLEKRGDKTALLWEPEEGAPVKISYRELHARVCRFANALRSLGVKQGDTVAVYLPMIPELPVALLACARIGAVHSVVFGGFSSVALADRIRGADAHVVFTAHSLPARILDAGDPYRLSKAGKGFIAGLLRHAREIAAITNPTVNSYKRPLPGFDARAYVSWARNNRSGAIDGRPTFAYSRAKRGDISVNTASTISRIGRKG